MHAWGARQGTGDESRVHRRRVGEETTTQRMELHRRAQRGRKSKSRSSQTQVYNIVPYLGGLLN